MKTKEKTLISLEHCGQLKKLCYNRSKMYEIEIKAHVNDRHKVQTILDSFAVYVGSCHKKDVYFKNNCNNLQIRIRDQENFSVQSTEPKKTTLVTYKRKARLKTDGTMEVNQEEEFTINNRESFMVFLQDAGFIPVLEKEKKVSTWKYEHVLIEVCTIPLLGDFIEMEVLSETKDKKTLEAIHNRFLLILKKCNISETEIEDKFYSELLGEKR